MKRSEIQKQAKEIIDKFAEALEQIEKQHLKDSFIDRTPSERKENNNKKPKDKDFKTRFLENSPKKNKDFILVERGNWK